MNGDNPTGKTVSSNVEELLQLFENIQSAMDPYKNSIIQIIERLETEIRHLTVENDMLKGNGRRERQ